MSERSILISFIAFAYTFAPIMTNKFFLNDSKIYANAHKLSLLFLISGFVLNINSLFFIWPAFCAYGFCYYLLKNNKSVFTLISIQEIAMCIPFIFSLISALWFISGLNDFKLLGYNPEWSFYAALHGSFLGWMFIGCLAYLSKNNPSNSAYLWGCYCCFIFFLFVAFGIDGIPYIKRIGVVGFSILIPLLIGFYRFELKKENKTSIIFSNLSLVSILASMAIAAFNEFWPPFPKTLFDLPLMVITHGLLNVFISIPFFYLAIRYEKNP